MMKGEATPNFMYEGKTMCLLCSILFGEGGRRASSDRSCDYGCGSTYSGCGSSYSGCGSTYSGCGSTYSGCGGCASAYSAAESNGASASASGAASPALSRGCGCGTYAAVQLCSPCCCTGFGRHGDGGVCCDEAYYCRQYALCCGRCKKVCCCYEKVICGRS